MFFRITSQPAATACHLAISSFIQLDVIQTVQNSDLPVQRAHYLLTPWCRVLLEKLTGLQLVKKFPAFHGTRRFITALTSVRHLSLSTSHLLDIRSNIIHPFTSPIRATCPAHLILLDFITRTILREEYKSFSSSLCSLLHSPVTSSLLGPNILLNTMFSNTLSFLSSRSVNDQVSHPYKTTGKMIVLYILISKFLDSNLEDKRFCTEL